MMLKFMGAAVENIWRAQGRGRLLSRVSGRWVFPQISWYLMLFKLTMSGTSVGTF